MNVAVLRVLVGHPGRALVPEKGQWMSVWSPSAPCRPAYSQTASVCDCLFQRPFSLWAPGSTVGLGF